MTHFNKVFQISLFCLVAFMLGLLVGQSFAVAKTSNGSPKVSFVNTDAAPKTVDVKLLWDVWEKLNQVYLFRDKLDPNKLLHGAAAGLVAAAGSSADDPYTAFFDPEENENFNKQLAGSYEGVGIQLGYKDKNLVVVTPIIDTPAYKAGVKSGDIIIGIDDKSAAGMTIPEAVSKIKGEHGSEVKLMMLRGSERKEFKLKRESIKINSVELYQKDGIAILKLNQFGTETNREWTEAIDKVATMELGNIPATYSLGEKASTSSATQPKGKVKGMILDLRGNPGGLLDEAVHIASEFTDKSPIVYQEDAAGQKKYYNIPEGRVGKLLDIPLVILVDGGSASASEIVTGALRDYKRAKVVGENSFGKGTVQGVVDLQDGSSIHVTTSKWVTPSGNWIHKTGIKPDVEVKRTDEDFAANKDPQLDKALELLK